MSIQPVVRLSAFRSGRRIWKPMDGFLYFGHTHPLGGVDVSFGVFEILPS